MQLVAVLCTVDMRIMCAFTKTEEPELSALRGNLSIHFVFKFSRRLIFLTRWRVRWPSSRGRGKGRSFSRGLLSSPAPLF